jgi:hypothetical protein
MASCKESGRQHFDDINVFGGDVIWISSVSLHGTSWVSPGIDCGLIPSPKSILIDASEMNAADYNQLRQKIYNHNHYIVIHKKKTSMEVCDAQSAPA